MRLSTDVSDISCGTLRWSVSEHAAVAIGRIADSQYGEPDANRQRECLALLNCCLRYNPTSSGLGEIISDDFPRFI